MNKPTVQQVRTAVEMTMQCDVLTTIKSYSLTERLARMMFVWALSTHCRMGFNEITAILFHGSKHRSHSTVAGMLYAWSQLPSWLRGMATMTFDRMLMEVRGERIPKGVLLHQGRMEAQ